MGVKRRRPCCSGLKSACFFPRRRDRLPCVTMESQPPPSTSRTSAPPASRRLRLHREPEPGAAPGTLMVEPGERSKIFLIDYCAERVVEKELASIEECIPYITDDTPSTTWIDVRGLRDR